MLKDIGNVKIGYRKAALLSLAVIPLSVVFVTLAGGGHASVPLMFPAQFLFGPLIFLAPHGGEAAVVFAIFGSYPLYLLYGLIMAFLSGSYPTACRLFLVAVLLIHVGISLLSLLSPSS